VGFVVDQVALRQDFLPAHRFSPVFIITPLFNAHSSTHCSYQTDKRAKPGYFPESNVVSEIRQQGIKRYFPFDIYLF
jgi:hypothetical protein